MNYELVKKLKEAGFQSECFEDFLAIGSSVPTLSELIEACGKDFESLSFVKVGTEEPSNTSWLENNWRWLAVASDDEGNTISDTSGETPKEAVANLWLALNKKQ